MRKPRALEKGDMIGLVGASSSVPPEILEPSIWAMEKMGFRVVTGESCFKKHGFLAGDDSLRSADINKMFADDSIAGVFCIRGGYGSQRLLNKIDFELIREKPKFFCGYSDATALHIAINQICDLITYHTPMPSTEIYKTLDDYTAYYYNSCVFGRTLRELMNPAGQEIKTLVKGSCEGELTGGNLSLLSSSLGTPYEIDTRGKILFIEEVEEEPYKIDRMLLQLKLAGKFSDCAGVILGAFTDCVPSRPDRSLSLTQIFEELVADEGKPAVYDLACGHCMPTMSLPLGARVALDAENRRVIIL